MKEYTFKGTPGPWVVEHQPSISRYVLDARHERTDFVAEIDASDGMPAKENAHLIAAAPDLLQACISLVDQLCGDQEAEDELEKGLGITLAWKVQQAKVAIHKALNL